MNDKELNAILNSENPLIALANNIGNKVQAKFPGAMDNGPVTVRLDHGEPVAIVDRDDDD